MITKSSPDKDIPILSSDGLQGRSWGEISSLCCLCARRAPARSFSPGPNGIRLETFAIKVSRVFSLSTYLGGFVRLLLGAEDGPRSRAAAAARAAHAPFSGYPSGRQKGRKKERSLAMEMAGSRASEQSYAFTRVSRES